MSSDAYELTRVRSGAWSLRSNADGEVMHPGLGPAAEAQALYVDQLQIRERAAELSGQFVVWDVGLGAAANAIAVIRSLQGTAARLRMLSFDNTVDPLSFALSHSAQLPHLHGFEAVASQLLEHRSAHLSAESFELTWEVVVGDFPTMLSGASRTSWPAPHAILFDPFSPRANPRMWTQELFSHLLGKLSAPCRLATYSRSTMVRVALLVAGFFVGAGTATGNKEETTVAANALTLIDRPLDDAWLHRALRSGSAEPLHDDTYRQMPATPDTRHRLHEHPQFKAASG